MKKMIQTTLIAAAACGLAASPSSADERPVTKGEAKLAKMLEGRVAGEAQRCIRTFPSHSLTIIDGTAIISRQGGTIYVNRTRNPDTLDDDDALRIRKFSATQLCRLDQVTTFDRHAQYYTGNVMLTDFVPYRKVDTES